MDEAGVAGRPGARQPRSVPRRGGHRPGAGAAPPEGPTDGDLRRQRPPGAGRLPGRPRGAAPIPEDLSVVGFDDLPVAQWVGPPMTTVRQPLIDMATAAAEMVLAMARGETPPRRGSNWPRSWSSARAPRRRRLRRPRLATPPSRQWRRLGLAERKRSRPPRRDGQPAARRADARTSTAPRRPSQRPRDRTCQGPSLPRGL